MLVWLGVAAGALAVAPRAGAQQRFYPYAEYRVDAINGRGSAIQGGVGPVIPLGVYTRVSVTVAGGPTWRDGGVQMSGRADLIARFLLDPFREARWGLSLGGGLTLPHTSGESRVQPYMTAVIDVEGRVWHGLSPAVQAGFGGGTRLGVALRTSPRAWR